MTRDPEKFLFDILDSARFLLEFTASETVERYRTDRAFRAAVERELQNVGEALMQLRNIRPEMAARISESAQIIGFRHVLVHGYFALDAATVWDVVQNKLSVLAQEAKDMLPEQGG